MSSNKALEAACRDLETRGAPALHAAYKRAGLVYTAFAPWNDPGALRLQREAMAALLLVAAE